MKNTNIGHLDPYEMQDRMFDPDTDSMRVRVIDGITLNVDKIDLPELKVPEQKTIEVPVIIKETDIHQVNVPVIIKEVQKVEVPVIIKEVEYKVVEVPVIVPEIKVIEIEKPVLIKETVFKELPTYIKICMIAQAIGSLGFMLIYLLKGHY